MAVGGQVAQGNVFVLMEYWPRVCVMWSLVRMDARTKDDTGSCLMLPNVYIRKQVVTLASHQCNRVLSF